MRDGRRVAQTSVTVDRLEALLSAEGRGLLDRLSREDPAVADSIRLGSSLREQFSPELVAAALTQHELRRVAEGKFSKASRMLFTRPGLEQASAEWCLAIGPPDSRVVGALLICVPG